MEGLRVGVTAARQGHVLVTAFERRGAHVCWGPTLGGDDTAEHADGELDTLLRRRPSWVVASTGVGVRMLLDTARRAGREDELGALLRDARVLARGAKAHGALRSLGVEPVFTSPQETDVDTAAWLARHVLAGDVVGVLAHGGACVDSYRSVEVAGGDLLLVRPYRSGQAVDPAPAEELIVVTCSGALDVVVCTSPGSFRNLLAIASDLGRSAELLTALRGHVAVAVVGPVTAAAVEEAGATVAVMPLRPRTAELVRAVEGWAGRGRRMPAGPVRLLPGEEQVELPDGRRRLGERELALLAALVRRPDVVCPAALLAREVWGHAAPPDAHAVKHLVSRIRRKLGAHAGAVETVRGVGYRYTPITVSPAR
jgi:uroporphyrinogen-III synthase